jgi:hypothetical protein
MSDSSMSTTLAFSFTSCRKSMASSSGWPAMLADRVGGRLQEVDVAHAGDLDRVLEGEEDAFARALLRVHGQEVLALVEDLALRDLVAGPAGQDVGERALAGAVRAHDRVDLALGHAEVHAAQDLVPPHGGVEVLHFEHGVFRCHPRLADGSLEGDAEQLLASTANSMGSSLKTSLQKPFTIMLTASSAEMPRCWKVEDLVLADLRGRGLVLHLGRRVEDLDVGKVCAPHLSPTSRESHCE